MTTFNDNTRALAEAEAARHTHEVTIARKRVGLGFYVRGFGNAHHYYEMWVGGSLVCRAANGLPEWFSWSSPDRERIEALCEQAPIVEMRLEETGEPGQKGRRELESVTYEVVSLWLTEKLEEHHEWLFGVEPEPEEWEHYESLAEACGF